MGNPYEQKARTEKAVKIADLLATEGYKSGRVAGFSDEHWNLAAAAARVNPPKGQETKDLVVRMLREREAVPHVA